MQFSFAKLALAALTIVELASALPASHPAEPVQKRSFKVNRVQVGTGQVDAAKAYLKALSKYGITPPAGLKEQVAATKLLKQNKAQTTKRLARKYKEKRQSNETDGTDQTGDVANNGVNGEAEFLSEISVGGQSMLMDFDTGSSDLWVFNTATPAEESAGHTIFDPTKSATFSPVEGASFSVDYGDGSSVAGNIVGTDTVNIGGATATSQTVELATSVAAEFAEDTASNGLVGLAYSQLNQVQPTQAKTFFDTIHEDLAQPVMTASLKHGEPGAYEFGTIDNSAFQGQIAFTDVNTTSGFWQFTSSQFAIGNGSVQENTAGSPAIADTGTTLMLVDPPVASAYYEAVPGAEIASGMFVFPCDSDAPDLNVAMGSGANAYMATIPASLIKFQQVQVTTEPATGEDAALRRRHSRKHNNKDSPTPTSGELADAAASTSAAAAASATGTPTSGTCIGGVQSNQGSGLQIYGDVMFKSQFTVFDLGNNQIGFAPHA